jgi:hypothetical protein
VIGMSTPEPFEVPADAPVVIHRQGRTGRPCVAVIVEAVPEGARPDAIEHALRSWRLRLGGWVTRADAADLLGLSVQRVDQLRRDGRLASRQIGDVTAIDVTSVNAELCSRSEEASGE